MFRAIHAIAPDAAFTLFTGDVTEHAIWNTTKAGNIERSTCTLFLTPLLATSSSLLLDIC